MLLVVLTLVLMAGGVLVTSVLIERPEWSWLSVLLSVLGAVLLIVEWLRRRREASSSPPGSASGRHRLAPRRAARPAAATGTDVVEERAKRPDAASAGAAAEPSGEPDEEDTDAADALLVSESDEEVVVVDEHPRYHLVGCDRLGARELLALPVREARSLGFTACAGCTPDAALARRLRAAS